MVASWKHEIMVKQEKWEKHHQPFLNLSTDESELANPGKIGGGWIVRDHQENMIYAFTITLGIGTNRAEIQETSHDLDWCIQHWYNKIHLEVDLESVARWLLNQTNPPQNLQQYIFQNPQSSASVGTVQGY